MNKKVLIMGLLSLFFLQKAKSQNIFNELTYTQKASTFSVVAPQKSRKVILRIYNEGTGGKPIKSIKMKWDGQQHWTATVKGNLVGKFYTFSVTVSDDYLNDLAQHHEPTKLSNNYYGETPGVFAKAVGVNGLRGAIIDMRYTNPSGWANDKRPALKSTSDLIIYELHHRDFSIDPSSGIFRKGKFLALTEEKAINHLKELGINAVHILPSFDYASVDETKLDTPQYNWGYDPLNYNVPEGSYSTYPYNPAIRIGEFKMMVQALHKAGIKVILDVVYNHTYNFWGSSFERTYPDEYYRWTADGKLSNGSGCGNETASEKYYMRHFIIESMKYWATEYHIDGFRIDLMGVHDIETINEANKVLKSVDPSIFIYGEGWSAGKCAYPTNQLAIKANMKQLPGIAAFCDDFRDALRGPYNDNSKGAFLASVPGSEESIKFGIVGAIRHPQIDMKKVNYSKEAWAEQPTQMISYVSCHDDMCLVDRLSTEIPRIKTPELIRIDELAQTAVFLSQGIPFMLSGEEMLRTKHGVSNSFNSPDAINELDWSSLNRYPKLFNYYKNLIALRKNHPAFRLGNADAVRLNLEFLPVQPCFVGFIIKNNAGGDTWKNIIVLLNANKTPITINIPNDDYTVVCCDGEINENGLSKLKGGEVSVPEQSAMILHN
jgi:pullulanase